MGRKRKKPRMVEVEYIWGPLDGFVGEVEANVTMVKARARGSDKVATYTVIYDQRRPLRALFMREPEATV